MRVALVPSACSDYENTSNTTTAPAGLKDLKARDGLLADLDFTGKLDLLGIRPDGSGLIVYRNLGSFFFQEKTGESGLPAAFAGAEHAVVEDWNNEDLPGVFVTRAGAPPAYFPKQRAGSFVKTNSPADWPSGSLIATGDLNNDLRADLIVAGDHDLGIVFGGMTERLSLPLRGLQAKGILVVDYDNDGWLDIIAWGNGLRVWRNLGRAGFVDVTTDLGLDKIGPVDGLVAADFDGDGDTDLMAPTRGGGRFLRNDGGNANRQLKLRLVGNRSNASGLGARVELSAGNWRTLRRCNNCPPETGVGKHARLDASQSSTGSIFSGTLVDLMAPTNQLTLDELTLPARSCLRIFTLGMAGDSSL